MEYNNDMDYSVQRAKKKRETTLNNIKTVLLVAGAILLLVFWSKPQYNTEERVYDYTELSEKAAVGDACVAHITEDDIVTSFSVEMTKTNALRNEVTIEVDYCVVSNDASGISVMRTLSDEDKSNNPSWFDIYAMTSGEFYNAISSPSGAELYGMVVAKPDITYGFNPDLLGKSGSDLLDAINADHAEQDFVDELIKKYPVFEVRSLTPQTHEADTDMNINGYLKYAGIIMLAAGLILLMVQGVMKRTKSQNS